MRGCVDTSRGVCPRSSHLQVFALGALKKWGKWSLDIKKASLRAYGLQREEFKNAPAEWGPSGTHRIWKWRAASSVLNDGPAAFRKTLHRSRFRRLAPAYIFCLVRLGAQWAPLPRISAMFWVAGDQTSF